MKVLFCKGSLAGSVSGADEIMVNYAVHLQAAGHSPSVLLTCPFNRDNQYYLRLREAGIRVSCLGYSPYFIALMAVCKLARLLPDLAPITAFRNWETMLYRSALYYFRRRRPDVAHVLVDAGFFIRVANTAGVPVLYQEMVTPWYEPRAESQVYYDKLADALPLCSEVVALSPQIAQLCSEQLPCPRPVSVLPLITADPVVDRLSSRPTHSAVTFGFASRMEWRKGPEVLLEAFALLPHNFPEARLKMAGAGDKDRAVAARAEAMGLADYCDFPGAYTNVEEKRSFMQSLDVFVLPSFAEGTPNSVIEAMAHGLPIIASSVGGVPDLVSSETGILVPPGDALALRDALLRLAEGKELRTQMGRAARERYERLFSPKAVLPVLLETYQRVIASQRGEFEMGTGCSTATLHPWAEVRA